MTLHIDETRYEALSALSAQTGKSMHSIILGGIDLATRRAEGPSAI